MEEACEKEAFKVVKEEAINQYRALMGNDDSHNMKIGILMGFIVVSLTQVALDLFRPSGRAECIAFAFHVAAAACFAASVGYGLKYIMPRLMDFGANIIDLRDKYNSGELADMEAHVCAAYIKAYRANEEYVIEKGKAIKKMICIYFGGLAALVISRIIVVF